MLVDAPCLDELFEQKDIDAVLGDRRVLERDGPGAVEPDLEPEVAAAQRTNEGAKNRHTDIDVHLAGFGTFDVDARSIIAVDGWWRDTAAFDEVADAAKTRQILTVAMQELERLRAQARDAKDAVAEASEKGDRLIWS